MRDAPDPRVNLEVALVRLVHPEADDSPAALLSRIERLEAVRRAPIAASGPSVRPPRRLRHRPGTATGAALAARAAAVSTGRAATPDLPRRRADEPAPRRSSHRPTGPDRSAPDPRCAHRRRAGSGRRPAMSQDARPKPDPSRRPPPPSRWPTRRRCRRRPWPPRTCRFPTRDQLVQAWGDQVIGRLRPKAKALFQAGRFVGADGTRAEFGLPERDPPEPVRGRCGPRSKPPSPTSSADRSRWCWWSTATPAPTAAASAGSDRCAVHPGTAGSEPAAGRRRHRGGPGRLRRRRTSRWPRSTTRPRPVCSRPSPAPRRWSRWRSSAGRSRI